MQDIYIDPWYLFNLNLALANLHFSQLEHHHWPCGSVAGLWSGMVLLT
jgi:hypothetical protein